MNVVSQSCNDGDGRSRTSLSELIGLRQRVAHARPVALVSRSARSGQQSSRLYGRGMDYAESRIYQPGDDVRRLDWRLAARSGKLHTKLFQEDREGCLLILLDTHASMQFGTRRRFKSVQAARAAAFAAWYAARAGERVGIMAFGRVEQILRPRAGTRGALAVCGALADWDAVSPSSRRDESLGDAVTRAGRLLHGASRVLLISDGFSCDAPARARLLGLARHAALSVLIIADVLERVPAPSGRYPVEHAGERSELLLQTERQRAEFQRAMGAGPARLSEMARSLGLRCAEVDTCADPFEQVDRLLGKPRPA